MSHTNDDGSGDGGGDPHVPGPPVPNIGGTEPTDPPVMQVGGTNVLEPVVLNEREEDSNTLDEVLRESEEFLNESNHGANVTSEIRYVTDIVDPVDLKNPKWNSVRPKFGKLKSYVGAEPTVIVGGKPTYEYTGLDPEDEVDETPLRFRSILPIKNQKTSSVRTTGLSCKFKRGGDLRNFSIEVKDHLRKHGLDTSSWLPDPSGADLANVLDKHALFADDQYETGCELSRELKRSVFDQILRTCDSEAASFLYDSLDPELKDDLRDQIEADDPFAVVWLQLVRLVISSCHQRYQNIKNEILQASPSQFSGENIEELSKFLKLKCKELDSAARFEPILCLELVHIFGRSTVKGIFEFKILSLTQKVEEAISKISFKSNLEQMATLKRYGLSYSHICEKAKDFYRELKDNNRWPPAKQPVDTAVPAKSFLTMSSESKQAVLTLVRQELKKDNSKETRTCFKCNKPGHLARNCPLNNDKSKSKNWKRTGPSQGESETRIKVVQSIFGVESVVVGTRRILLPSMSRVKESLPQQRQSSLKDLRMC